MKFIKFTMTISEVFPKYSILSLFKKKSKRWVTSSVLLMNPERIVSRNVD